MQALKALHAAGALGDARISVIMNGDEEDVGEPRGLARRALRELADAADVALGFEDGAGDPRSGDCAAGIDAVDAAGHRQGGHSSQIFRDDVGAGAIFEAARVLQLFRERLSSEPLLTFNPGGIVGGTTVTFDREQSRGTAAGKTNVVAAQAIVEGDVRALSPEQLELAKQAMQRIVARAAAAHVVDDSVRRQLSAHGADRGEPPAAAVLRPGEPRPRRRPRIRERSAQAGAADISFTAGRVEMALDGIGLMGRDDHSEHETADLGDAAVADETRRGVDLPAHAPAAVGVRPEAVRWRARAGERRRSAFRHRPRFQRSDSTATASSPLQPLRHRPPSHRHRLRARERHSCHSLYAAWMPLSRREFVATAVAAALSGRGGAASAPPWLDAYRDQAARLIGAALADASAWNRIAELTDTFGHRLSGSLALEDAIAWVVRTMRSDGLENVRAEPVRVPRWVRGRESLEIVSPYPNRLAMLGLGDSVGTPAEGLEADLLVVSGYDELDRRGGGSRGTHRALQRPVHRLRRHRDVPHLRAHPRGAGGRGRVPRAIRGQQRPAHAPHRHARLPQRRAPDSGRRNPHRGRVASAATRRPRRARAPAPVDGGRRCRARPIRPTSSARSSAVSARRRSSSSAATSTRGTSGRAR